MLPKNCYFTKAYRMLNRPFSLNNKHNYVSQPHEVVASNDLMALLMEARVKVFALLYADSDHVITCCVHVHTVLYTYRIV